MLHRAIGHIINCKQATRLISQMQDSPAGWFARWTLRMHLAVCVACTRFERQLHFMRKAMQKYRE